MPKLAANLSMMFTEVPFLDRFAAAAKAGFSGVEFLFPYDFTPKEIAARLADNNLSLALFNLPPGKWGSADWENGVRGIAALPERRADFAAGLELALPYIAALKPPHVHMMAGILPDGADRGAAENSFLSNMAAAAKAVAPSGTVVLSEPINPRDMPGYFVSGQAQALALLAQVGAENVALQMDFYHCQIVEGDLAMTLRKNFASIGHIQIAGVPDRHEPDGDNEVNFPYMLDLLDTLGYQGWVGCEYNPRGTTLDGLAWAEPYLS